MASAEEGADVLSPSKNAKEREENEKNRRIVVLLSAILLILAVACSGDNPAPSGGNGNGSANEIPGAPAVNTGSATQKDLIGYAMIGMSLNPIGSDSELGEYMSSPERGETLSFTNKAGTLTLSGTSSATSMSLTCSMNEYSIKAVTSDSSNGVDCTVWGILTMLGDPNEEQYNAEMVYDYVVRIDSTGEVFSLYMRNKPSYSMEVNGQLIQQSPTA